MNMRDDRRRTGASVAYGHDHQAFRGLNLSPQRRIISRVAARLSSILGLDFGHVHVEPLHHLLEDDVRIVERLVDEEDGLAVESLGPFRHRLELDRRLVARRIQDHERRLLCGGTRTYEPECKPEKFEARRRKSAQTHFYK